MLDNTIEICRIIHDSRVIIALVLIVRYYCLQILRIFIEFDSGERRYDHRWRHRSYGAGL